MAEEKQYEIRDRIKYQLVKDYNGRSFPFMEKSTLDDALAFAEKTVDSANAGVRLTVRIFEQVAFVRKEKRKDA